ncbi:MAG TPA: helix-turn-helix domain-containing protein [Candidatus Deferrimicrobium sp.]|nr:helix-turn-helix domain-containing protein [Candidatus Deferrimicrobium sp.]
MIDIDGKRYNCPVEVALDVIGGKWKALVLWHLKDDVRRFSELKRLMPGITQKMLTQQLRELEADGIIARTVYPEVPPRVEYALTQHGQTLQPLLKTMCEWGARHAQGREATIATDSVAAGHSACPAAEK